MPVRDLNHDLCDTGAAQHSAVFCNILFPSGFNITRYAGEKTRASIKYAVDSTGEKS